MAGRAAYRTLLRALNRHVGDEALRTYCKRRMAAAGDSEAAREYAELLTSVHEHKALLMSYNISTDKYASRKEQLKGVAGSVGLRMPEEYESTEEYEKRRGG